MNFKILNYCSFVIIIVLIIMFNFISLQSKEQILDIKYNINIVDNTNESTTKFIFKDITIKNNIFQDIKVEPIYKEVESYKSNNSINMSEEQQLLYLSYLELNKEKLMERLALDVSAWQGDIDWELLANNGIRYAILRIGYSGTLYGETNVDTLFDNNAKEAINNNIKIGGYYFSQALTEKDIIEEANLCIEQMNKYNITLPIYFDMEWAEDGRSNSLSKAQRTKLTKLFCETIENTGYNAGIYGNINFFEYFVDYNEISKYDIWLAEYKHEENLPIPTIFNHRYDIWQYSCFGKIEGIDGDVDLNVMNKIYN